MRGLRYWLRNFTASAVREHLRSQLERTEPGAELTPNEVALVRFAATHAEGLNELAGLERELAEVRQPRDADADEP